MKAQPLSPNQIIFFRANDEEAAPGWYKVIKFDHEMSREYPEEGWCWVCKRLCDGLIQSISEKSEFLIADCVGAPELS